MPPSITPTNIVLVGLGHLLMELQGSAITELEASNKSHGDTRRADA
jgi:hypothetical protein